METMTSAPADPAARRGQLRWRCMRRGLLELDLVFQRFLDQRFDTLGEDHLNALEELLKYEDVDLWPLVSGREECGDSRLREMVDILRAT
ncbi:MAG: succinate dehydrogenase assembly factor 2 [Rhodocyclaceae bacterium]